MKTERPLIAKLMENATMSSGKEGHAICTFNIETGNESNKSEPTLGM